MAHKASGTLEKSTKDQYIFSLVCGESLHQFDLLSADAESANPITVKAIIFYHKIGARCSVE